MAETGRSAGPDRAIIRRHGGDHRDADEYGGDLEERAVVNQLPSRTERAMLRGVRSAVWLELRIAHEGLLAAGTGSGRGYFE